MTMCRDSPTMTCRAEVTGSLVPTVAKQMQSVEPWTKQTNWETVSHWKRFHCQKKPSGIFACEPDLPGWCRCEGSRETELPPDSLGPRRRPPASSRPGRGWSRWTCHPLRHTPPWAGEPKKKSSVTGWTEACAMEEAGTEIYFKGTKFKVCFFVTLVLYVSSWRFLFNCKMFSFSPMTSTLIVICRRRK